MATQNLGARLPIRIAALATGMWLFVSIFSYVFIYLVFNIPQDRWTEFTTVFFGSSIAVTLLSVVVAFRSCIPLAEFVRQRESGEKIDTASANRVARVGQGLYLKMAGIGFSGPLLLLASLGFIYSGPSSGEGPHLLAFVVLGLFDSMLLGIVLALLPTIWVSGILELLATCCESSAWTGRGVSLKSKTLAICLGLAIVPSLLVGTMSFFTANRIMGEELSRRLTDQLAAIHQRLQANGNAANGAKAIDEEASKIAPDTFVVLKNISNGETLQSKGAPEIKKALFDLLKIEKGPKRSGAVVDPGGTGTYAYAFSEDGSTVLIAPIRGEIQSRATQGLLGIVVGICLCSIFLAAVVGYLFASHLSRKIRRMADVTEEVASGNLVREVRVVSDDEIGSLGASLFAMSENLRRMVRGMTSLGGQIVSTCNQLSVKASAISTGAEIQSRSVHEMSDTVKDLNGNIQLASEGIRGLADSSQETAEAADKVGQGFSMMLTECDSVQQRVDRTGQIVSRIVVSVREVAGIITELSEGSKRSAQSMSEIDRSISEVSSRAAETALIARKAIEVAQEGAISVRHTIEGMDRIVESTRQASDVIMGLGNRIEAIGSILGVIEEIADQTNLLALNAAIIAAQAGEHGRGFAVVADEIRSLAERTATSTREIAQMISDIQEASGDAIKVMRGGDSTVNEGVSLAKQAGNGLNQILANVQKAAENVESIAGYTERQAKSSVVVAREIAQVAEMGGRIAQAASEQGRSGEELQLAFQETLRTSQSLGKMVSQQAQENRMAMAAIATINEAAARSNQALQDQSKVSDGILMVIDQVREIAKNHAKAAAEMGEATQTLVEKSARLKEEIDAFRV